MLTKLVSLVLAGTVAVGTGGYASDFIENLSAEEQEAIVSAKEASVEVLTDEEKEFVATLEDKEMKDLTQEEREQVREIHRKMSDATMENITDEELKAKLDEFHEERREERKANRENRTRGGEHGFRNSNQE